MLNFSQIKNEIYYTTQKIQRLFEENLGMNSSVDQSIQDQTNLQFFDTISSALNNEKFYSDARIIDIFTSYIRENPKIGEVFYTDSKIRELFTNFVRSISTEDLTNSDIISKNIDNIRNIVSIINKPIAENEVKDQFVKYSGYQENPINPENPLNSEYSIYNNSSSQSQIVYYIDVFFNRFINTQNLTVIPSIIPTTPGALNYRELITGISEFDSRTAALWGTNLGQIEGPLYQAPKSDIIETTVNLGASLGSIGLNSAVNGLVGLKPSINPNKARLIDRLKNFNIVDPDTTSERESFLAYHDPEKVRSYSVNQSGDAEIIPSIPVLLGTQSSLNNSRNDTKTAVEKLISLYNLEDEFVNFGSPTAQDSWLNLNVKPTATTISQDKFSIGNPSISGSNITLQDNSTTISNIKRDMQFPFFFEEVGDSGSWCGFPATIKPFSESFSPEFSPGNTFFGRTERAVTYSGTQRNLNLDFVLLVEDPDDFDIYKKRINWLTQRVYAKYHQVDQGEGKLPLYKTPPLIRITIGDLYYRLGGYINSLNYNWNQDGDVWEKSLEGKRIPRFCGVNMAFTVLHDFVPDGNSQFWSWTYDR
jgi:hypothetical protein